MIFNINSTHGHTGSLLVSKVVRVVSDATLARQVDRFVAVSITSCRIDNLRHGHWIGVVHIFQSYDM